MSDRDCKNCLYARTPDDPYSNGCTAWSCEYIDRQEAIKLIKSIVRCKDCKWAKKEGDEGEGNLTCACHIPRFIVPSDGFCYLGERRNNEGTTE